MCFKVHRSQLARFCTVFEDMLGVPSGGPDEELIEDVVVVRMYDDAKDLTNFLSALYNGWTFNFDIHTPQNFPAIAGVMRLATKYDCSVLRSRIFKTLTARYPSPPHGIYTFYQDLVPHASVINLARECDIPEVLPSCFYELSFCTKGSDMGRTDTLSPTDRQRVMQGRSAILRRLSKLVSEGMPGIVCPIAVSSHKAKGERLKCITFMERYWEERVVAGSESEGPIMVDPLKALSDLCSPEAEVVYGLMPFRFSEREKPMCGACKSEFNTHLQRIVYAKRTNLVVDFEL